MNNNKLALVVLTVAVVGVGLYAYLLKPNWYSGLVKPNQSPAASQSPSLSAPGETEEPFSSLLGIKSPATCQVGGEVNFSDRNTFASNGSKISWQNVDSQGRLINWKITPNDNLAIGPNIFANLTVPSGVYENITVRLPENPVSRAYTLTGSVTYGQFIKGDLKVKETNCSGQVKVNLNF